MLKRNMVYGIIGVGVNKGNYNASFDKTPKANGDGVMYATPQCLQYAIRHQLQKEGYKVLYKKSSCETGVRTLQQAFNYYTGINLADKETDITEQQIKKILLTDFIDVSLFGCTFTGKGNIGILGATQINFGTNRYEDTQIIVDDIISPFANPNESTKKKDDEDKTKSSSLGTQIIADEAHYTHSFTLNPLEYDQYKNELTDYEGFLQEDYIAFKEASLIAVSNYNSRAKSGCQNEFSMFVELKEGVKNQINLNGLDQYIKIKKDLETNKIIYDLSAISKILNSCKDIIESVEIYYNSFKLDIISDLENAKIFNIITRKEM